MSDPDQSKAVLNGSGNNCSNHTCLPHEMSSPTIQHISLHTPPASPQSAYIKLDADTMEDSSTVPFVSPVKASRFVQARRSNTGPKGKKRQRTQATDHLELEIPLFPIRDEIPLFAEPHAPQTAQSSADFTMVEQDGDGSGYVEYADSVLADGAPFYQIGKELFIVNGWDSKAKRSKVG